MKRMEKEIKKLLEKDTLTGDDAGRIMILDLLAAYEDLSAGGEGCGVLTDAKKINIVSSLTFSDDISRFNDYRGVHDFLTTIPAVYDSYEKTFEVYYWRLANLLTSIRHAEDESFLLEQFPVVMTKEQYRQFLESGEEAPACGIAVLQGDREAPPKTHSEWRELYMAETVLEKHPRFIIEAINGMNDMLAECLARKKALELIARYVRIPAVKILLPDIDETKIQNINALMKGAIKSVRRGKRSIGYERALTLGMSNLLTPIDLDALTPLAEDVTGARRSLNFSVIKNGSEAFVASLKRKWRK